MLLVEVCETFPVGYDKKFESTIFQNSMLNEAFAPASTERPFTNTCKGMQTNQSAHKIVNKESPIESRT